jgi:hypothetical protein
MHRLAAIALVSALTVFAGCAPDSEPAPLAGGEIADTPTPLDPAEFDELTDLFETSFIHGSEIWYLGTGVDLSFDNDVCSADYAHEQASDPWALDSVVTDVELSLETYLVKHLPSDLNAARARHPDSDATVVDQDVSRLRAFLIRAALQSTSIRRVGESDRFGGYRCIEITTPAGSFLVASGRWS